MEENFNPVAQTRANYYTPGSPVQFVCVELLKGDVSGEHAVCLTFKNISRVTLTALEIHFKCKGVDGVILCEDKFEYRDLQVKPGELFGQDDAVFITAKAITSVDVTLCNVYNGKRVVHLDGIKRVRLPAPRRLAPELQKALEAVEGVAEAKVSHESGTAVVLHLKEDTDDFKPSEFLSEYKLREMVEKYSDYIRYPIQTLVTKSKKEEGSDKYTSYTEMETLNSMVPLWARPRNKVKKKEYEEFYKQKFNDYLEPAYTIKADIEGAVNYKALLFVPQHAPYDYYTKEYKRGLKLYSAGVLIMDSCADLLPDCFGFIKGVVDSPDLSLNISREVLQQDRQLKTIAESLEKKIVAEFKKFLKNDREGYEKMFGEYAASIKFGVYDKFGAKKDALKDIVLFYSSYEKKLTLLSEYVSRMKEGQEFIYYACGEDVAKIDRLPTTEAVKDKGYEVLYLADSIDEFVLKTLDEYGGKKFKSVSAKDGVAKTEEETAREKSAEEENKSLTDAVKTALGGKVGDVRLNVGLKNHAVCLVAGGEISFEMERVFAAMPGNKGAGLKAERVLELNPDHPVFARLKKAAGTPDFDELCSVLYDEALLIEGFKLDDPAGFAEKINKLLGA